MPSKNTVRIYNSDEYYHVYNRGVEKRLIFLDEQDYRVFIGLLKKYLTGEKPLGSKNRHKFKYLKDEVQLLSYCLMPNHFHLLLYQKSETGISTLMKKLATGYVMYFNDRYDRVGGLFQGVYKASHISTDPYLYHISRYIHLNPEDYINYPYSSIRYYIENRQKPEWLDTEKLLSLFDNSQEQYAAFVNEYSLSDKEISEVDKIIAG